MPEEDIAHFVADLKNHNTSPINFTGGEISHIEEINPGYIERIVVNALENKNPVGLLSNASWINKPIKDRMLKTLAAIYTWQPNGFYLQMSFDSYHKDCIPNVNRVIRELSAELNAHPISRVNEPTYSVHVNGFQHEPEFRNNLDATGCDNMRILNRSVWNLYAAGRANTNKLKIHRDIAQEFRNMLNGKHKIWEAIFLCCHPAEQEKYSLRSMVTFEPNGMARAVNFRSTACRRKFTTPYRDSNGKYKSVLQIRTELAKQIYTYVMNKR
jgi:hypothetical protein